MAETFEVTAVCGDHGKANHTQEEHKDSDANPEGLQSTPAIG